MIKDVITYHLWQDIWLLNERKKEEEKRKLGDTKCPHTPCCVFVKKTYTHAHCMYECKEPDLLLSLYDFVWGLCVKKKYSVLLLLLTSYFCFSPDDNFLCFTKNEPVGVCGAIIPVSICGFLFIFFPSDCIGKLKDSNDNIMWRHPQGNDN